MPKNLAILILTVVAVTTGCMSADIRAPVFEGGKAVEPVRQVAAKTTPQPRFYIVRRGDTLYSIAWRENLDYRALATWNQLPSSYTIHPGQLLRLNPPPTPTYVGKTSKSARLTKAKVIRKSPSRSTVAKKSKPRPVEHLSKRSGRLRWRWPTQGKIAKAYSARDEGRKGIQIAGRVGQPIYAAEQGKVVYSGSGLMGYGRLIIVKHDKYFLSAYGHNRKILVKEGSIVSAGQKIAEMGTSDKGRPLLHFEIRKNGKPVNPVKLLPKQ